MRAAEKCAKEQRLRIWKDYQTNSPAVPIKDKEHQVVVTEIINGDALAVKMPNGTSKKIFLSSIRPPKEKYVLKLLLCIKNDQLNISIYFFVGLLRTMIKPRVITKLYHSVHFMTFLGCLKLANIFVKC